MSRARALLAGLGLSAISLTLTFAALELTLRTGLVSPREYRSTRIETLARSDLMRPHFRRLQIVRRETHDAFRIVVIGDSFAWGDGVHPEDAFPRRLETRLEALSRGPRFEVVSWSRPGWNTVQQVRALEGALPELDPDVLILTFVLNDPEPTNLKRRNLMLASARRRDPGPGVSEWFFRNSRLYAFVWTRLENRRQHRAVSAYYRALYEGEHWDACLRSLRRLRNLARERQVPLLVFVLPVFDGAMDDSYPYFDLHERIRTEVEKLRIPVVDLFEHYRDVEGRRLAVIPYTNPHPSELAHRLTADAMLVHLARRELLPGVPLRIVRKGLRSPAAPSTHPRAASRP